MLTRRESPATVALVIALAAALRAIHANAEFWFDEIVTVLSFVWVPLETVVTDYGLANNHVLHSVLVHAVASAAGSDPWAVRLPAILFGIAGVWAFWFTASAVWPRVPALLGTFLFAISYHHVHYSQNARGYSALIFFGLLSTGCLLRLLEDERRPRHLAGYILAIALGLYAMLLMVFVAAGHACVIVARRRWRALGALGAGVGAAAVLYAPMASSLIEYYRTRPAETGYPLPSAEFARALAPLAPVLVVGGLVAIPLILRLATRRPTAAAVLVAPIAFNVLVPLVRGQGVYPRSFVFGLAVAYLLLIEAIDAARAARPAFAWAIVAIVSLASVMQLVPYYQLPKQGFRQALAYVDTQRAAGDERLGFTLGGKAARFYDPSVVLIENSAQLQAWTRGGRPAWIVSTFPAQMRSSDPALYEWLQREAEHKAEFPGVIGDGTVHVHYWRPR